MITIIAGSRDFNDFNFIYEHLNNLPFEIDEVVTGCARGPDSIGKQWAVDSDVHVKEFPANWDKHGKRAGFLRNKEMAVYAEALILFWDGKSKGSKHMLDVALKEQLFVQVVEI